VIGRSIKVDRQEFQLTAGNAGDSSPTIVLSCYVTVASPQAAFLVLTEHDHPSTSTLTGTLEVDGNLTSMVISSTSQTGWGASGAARPEHWVFQSAPLCPGKHRIALKLASDRATSTSTVSAWVWASKTDAAQASNYSNLLPRPELISLDGACLMKPINLLDTPASRIP
jgi:hypothetical protein